MTTQYAVGRFLIDLFFHDYNLAVECDERHHDNPTNIDKDLARHDFFQSHLDCDVIRYRPLEKEFCIFKVINEIFRHIVEFKQR